MLLRIDVYPKEDKEQPEPDASSRHLLLPARRLYTNLACTGGVSEQQDDDADLWGRLLTVGRSSSRGHCNDVTFEADKSVSRQNHCCLRLVYQPPSSDDSKPADAAAAQPPPVVDVEYKKKHGKKETVVQKSVWLPPPPRNDEERQACAADSSGTCLVLENSGKLGTVVWIPKSGNDNSGALPPEQSSTTARLLQLAQQQQDQPPTDYYTETWLEADQSKVIPSASLDSSLPILIQSGKMGSLMTVQRVRAFGDEAPLEVPLQHVSARLRGDKQEEAPTKPASKSRRTPRGRKKKEEAPAIAVTDRTPRWLSLCLGLDVVTAEDKHKTKKSSSRKPKPTHVVVPVQFPGEAADDASESEHVPVDLRLLLDLLQNKTESASSEGSVPRLLVSKDDAALWLLETLLQRSSPNDPWIHDCTDFAPRRWVTQQGRTNPRLLEDFTCFATVPLATSAKKGDKSKNAKLLELMQRLLTAVGARVIPLLDPEHQGQKPIDEAVRNCIETYRKNSPHDKTTCFGVELLEANKKEREQQQVLQELGIPLVALPDLVQSILMQQPVQLLPASSSTASLPKQQEADGPRDSAFNAPPSISSMTTAGTKAAASQLQSIPGVQEEQDASGSSETQFPVVMDQEVFEPQKEQLPADNHKKGEVTSTHPMDTAGLETEKAKRKASDEPVASSHTERAGEKDEERPKKRSKTVKPKPPPMEEPEDDGPKTLKVTADGWMVKAPKGKKRKAYVRSPSKTDSPTNPVAETEVCKGMLSKTSPNTDADDSPVRETTRPNVAATGPNFKRFRKNLVVRQPRKKNLRQCRTVLPAETEQSQQYEEEREQMEEQRRMADELFRDPGRGGGSRGAASSRRRKIRH